MPRERRAGFDESYVISRGGGDDPGGRGGPLVAGEAADGIVVGSAPGPSKSLQAAPMPSKPCAAIAPGARSS